MAFTTGFNCPSVKDRVAGNKRFLLLAVILYIVVGMYVTVPLVGDFINDAREEAAEGLMDGATNGKFGSDRDGLRETRRNARNDTAMTYKERVALVKDICVKENAGSNTSCLAIDLEQNVQIIDHAFDAVATSMREHDDTVDFDFPALAHILLDHMGDPNLGEINEKSIIDAVLSMMWWMDEPGGFGDMQMWSENHRLLFHTAQYLFGTALPEEIFRNTNTSGEENRQKAKTLLETYFEEKISWGFAEFLADTYNDFDIACLAFLVKHAPDSNIKTTAAGLLDLILYDIISHSRNGIIVTARGRADSKQFRFDFQTMSCPLYLLTGIGYCDNPPSRGAVALTLSSYEPPEALLEAATLFATRTEPIVTRERFGLDPADAASEGVTSTKEGNLTPEDSITWFNHEGYFAPISATAVFVVCDAYNFWFHSMFKQVKDYRPISFLIPLLTRMIPAVTGGSLLGPANVYTYVTEHASLGSAIDYNAGGMGANQISWTAQLGHDIPIFVNMPGRSGFWRGSVSLPRVAQYERVLISIFHAPNDVLELVNPNRTHAFWPYPHLDETIKPNPFMSENLGDRWIFGRSGKGYVALISMNDFSFTTTGQYTMQEIVAEGTTNVWVCVIGDEKTDGGFASFQSYVRRSLTKLTIEEIKFDDLSFGWRKPFSKGGEEIATNHFPRYDTPYMKAPWKARCFLIETPNNAHFIDFDSNTRGENDPTSSTSCTHDPNDLYRDVDSSYYSHDQYNVPYFIRWWYAWALFGILLVVLILIFLLFFLIQRCVNFRIERSGPGGSNSRNMESMVKNIDDGITPLFTSAILYKNEARCRKRHQ